ncbi:MAG: hypothetical protein M1135_03790 [Candidatus Omnitrophica bacterium]|jgi:hypothetical protein|nr:hypothetical protein [Candidatus Omnitrophota bacterium]
MKKYIFILIPLTFSIFLVGCGQGYVNTPSGTMYQHTFSSAIKEKRIEIGMDMKNVLESWGNPIKTEGIQIKNKYYTVWAYNRNNNIIVLYFYHDKLTYIQE